MIPRIENREDGTWYIGHSGETKVVEMEKRHLVNSLLKANTLATGQGLSDEGIHEVERVEAVLREEVIRRLTA